MTKLFGFLERNTAYDLFRSSHLNRDKRLTEVNNGTFYWSNFLKVQLEALKAKFTARSAQSTKSTTC